MARHKWLISWNGLLGLFPLESIPQPLNLISAGSRATVTGVKQHCVGAIPMSCVALSLSPCVAAIGDLLRFMPITYLVEQFCHKLLISLTFHL